LASKISRKISEANAKPKEMEFYLSPNADGSERLEKINLNASRSSKHNRSVLDLSFTGDQRSVS
jgi:hypothetical protein